MSLDPCTINGVSNRRPGWVRTRSVVRGRGGVGSSVALDRHTQVGLGPSVTRLVGGGKSVPICLPVILTPAGADRPTG